MWKVIVAQLRVKAEVVSRKKLLWSDPNIKKMNPTQWLMELESIAVLDERKYDDISALFKVARRNIIDLLGLNLMPVEHTIESDSGEQLVMLRRPEDHEVIPLAILCGNEAILKEISDKNSEMVEQENIDQKEREGTVKVMTPEELDEFIQGDLEFPSDPEQLEKVLKWKSEENQMMLKSMVQPLSKKDDHLKTFIGGRPDRTSKVRIKKD